MWWTRNGTVRLILTTYSNLANHPKVIEQVPNSRKARKPKTELVAFADAKKEPVVDNAEEGAAEKPVVNKGVARKKEETPEERKARKAAVKKDRKAARETKKSLKSAYKAEATSQKNHVNAVPFYAKTVIPMNQ